MELAGPARKRVPSSRHLDSHFVGFSSTRKFAEMIQADSNASRRIAGPAW